MPLEKMICGENYTTELLKENVNELITKTNAVVHVSMDSLSAGGSGDSSFNAAFQNYMRGASGFGGLYLPFASFMEFAPNDYAYNLCSVYSVGSGRKWVDSVSDWTDERRVNSINGLGFYYDGTQASTGSGFGVNVGFKYTKIRLFYRQHPSGGTFNIDQPTFGQAYTGVDTSGDESLQYVDVSLYRDDTPTDAGTINNVGYNLRIIDVAGDVQVHGCLIITGDQAPVIVNDARSGRRLNDYVKVSPQVRTDFLKYCGITHSLFNAGTNDTGTSTPSEFEADLSDAISVITGVGVEVFIVIPNYNSQEATAAFKQSYLNVANQFNTKIYDIPSIWGDYATFQANGWMADSTHPNDFFTKLLGQAYSNLIINSAKFELPDLL